ncbi:hypothetical protein BD309DRAFT_1059487 [Dichomitus squalens]|nr:hypothetical protein BD309DRAFT_1059487 [Dichomitus squalens]
MPTKTAMLTFIVQSPVVVGNRRAANIPLPLIPVFRKTLNSRRGPTEYGKVLVKRSLAAPTLPNRARSGSDVKRSSTRPLADRHIYEQGTADHGQIRRDVDPPGVRFTITGRDADTIEKCTVIPHPVGHPQRLRPRLERQTLAIHGNLRCTRPTLAFDQTHFTLIGLDNFVFKAYHEARPLRAISGIYKKKKKKKKEEEEEEEALQGSVILCARPILRVRARWVIWGAYSS